MTDEKAVRDWMESYLKAWSSNDPADIAALFTENARYYTAPFREPWTGPDAIAEGWVDRKDDPGTWDFRWELLALAGDLAFVQGWTIYHPPNALRYSNLWVIRLDGQGRCSEFTEWWMQED